MVNSKQKKILVFQGPGFSNLEILASSLEKMNWEVRRVDIVPHQPPLPADIFKEIDIVLISGPYRLSPEDRLETEILATRIQAQFPNFMSLIEPKIPSQRPMLIGIGKGALLILRLMDKNNYLQIFWEEALVGSGIWHSLKDAEKEFYCHALAFSSWVPQQTPSFFTKWLSTKEAAVAFKHSMLPIYISFMDFLALHKTEQLPQFGYDDLSAIPTHTDILSLMVKDL